VAYNTAGDVTVRTWDGVQWVQLGGAVDLDPGNNVFPRGIVIGGDGNPIVNWIEDADMVVARWGGTDWAQMGDILDVVPGANAFTGSMAADADGVPFVAWQELGATNIVYVKYWDGAAWQSLGTALNVNPAQNAYDPEISVDSDGNAVAFFQENPGAKGVVRRWSVSTWDTVGTPIDNFGGENTTLRGLAAGAGPPVVALTEVDFSIQVMGPGGWYPVYSAPNGFGRVRQDSQGNAFVFQRVSGSAWALQVLEGTTLRTLGVTAASAGRLDITSSGEIVLVVQRGNSIFGLRYNG
jgi:hypothetical protein